MGISRVVVKATHIGQIKEGEGMVTVNYRGGQVSNQNENHSKSIKISLLEGSLHSTLVCTAKNDL